MLARLKKRTAPPVDLFDDCLSMQALPPTTAGLSWMERRTNHANQTMAFEDANKYAESLAAESCAAAPTRVTSPGSSSGRHNYVPIPEWVCAAMSRPWNVPDSDLTKAYTAACDALVGHVSCVFVRRDGSHGCMHVCVCVYVCMCVCMCIMTR
jgi:hypothetical protein